MTRNPPQAQDNFQGGGQHNHSYEQPQYDNNGQIYGNAMYGQAPPQQPYEQYYSGNNAPGPSYYSSNDQPYQQYPPQSRDEVYSGPPQYENENQQYPGAAAQYQGYASTPGFPQSGQRWDGQIDDFRSHYDQPHGSPESNQDMSGTYHDRTNPADRGIMGALGGAAAGGFAGHKVHHGFLGGVGGAIAGSMLEDTYKKRHKSRRGSHGSSSSSNSSHDEKQHDQHGRHADQGVLAGNFHASARNIRLDGHATLVAEVMDVHGHHQYSTIDLNDCCTNDGGQLKWAKGGNFAATARNIRLEEGGSVMIAELGDGRGGWQWNRVHLSERISNDNGRLILI